MSLDLRYAWRSLLRNPVTTLTIVLLLGLGIGANTVIFSVIDALLLRPLPVQHPEELVELYDLDALRTPDFGWGDCQRLLDRKPESLSDVACEGSLFVAVSDGTHLERRRVGVISQNYFSFLGVNPLLGHLPGVQAVPEDQSSAMISASFWQEWFHGDPNVLGRTVTISGHPFVVSAVLPRGFNGIQPDTGADIRITRRGHEPFEDKNSYMSTWIVGRLPLGVSLTAPRDQATAIWQAAWTPERRSLPAVPTEFVRIGTGSSLLRDQFGGALILLMYGVAGLLLIVCANVAGLLVARAAVRSRESALRVAVGASRWQLIRQVVAESVLLMAAGMTLGIAVTYAAMPLALRAMPPMRDRIAFLHPLRLEVSPDLRVLGFTLALCAVTALIFAIAPAIEATRANAHDALKEARSSRSNTRSRSILVAIQVALCTILLLGAGLLVRTLDALRSLNPGVDARHIVTFSLDPRMSGHTNESGAALQKRLLEDTLALPGVEAASYAGRALMRGTGLKSTVAPEGMLTPPGGELNTSINAVSADYFATMGIRLLAGRNFLASDHIVVGPDGMPTTKMSNVIVNQAFANYFFPNADPLGKRLGPRGKPDTQIVGVVTDTKYRSLREASPRIMYDYLDPDRSGAILHVRTAGDPGALIPTVQALLRGIDPRLPFYETHTLAEEIDASLWQDRLVAWLSSLFGVIAATLAGIGLYGMLAYHVAQRRREIGIRMSLGAPPRSIVGMISWQAMLPVPVGLVLGVLGFAAGAKYLKTLLYGITPWDPWALSVAMGFVLIISAAAVAIPALQAVRVNPATALREDC